MNNYLKKSASTIKNGGIIIFPTDTAFGIGCRLDDKDAVKRLFKLRRRPEKKPVPVLVDSIETAQKYLSPISNDVRHLMRSYWPGALTIIYPCLMKKIPPLVYGPGNTLGVRMPDHKLILSLIKKVGVPILGPSANFHGLPTPYKYEDLDENLLKLVDFVLPGVCNKGKVSTVVDCSQKPWRVIRYGAVELFL